jgi:hypothetical protein
MADQFDEVIVNKDQVVPDEAHPLEHKDRLTCAFSMTHEHIGYQPMGCDIRFSDMLESFDEQPVMRRITVTKEEKPLDLGHLEPEHIGYIVVESRVGKSLLKIPSEEEKAVHKQQTIRIRSNGDGMGLMVPPGKFICVCLEDPSDLWISCDVGTCKAVLWIYPR